MGALGFVTRRWWLPTVGTSLVLAVRAPKNAGSFDILAIPNSQWLPTGFGSNRAEFASEWIRTRHTSIVVMTCGRVYDVSGCEMAQNSLVAAGLPKLPLREVPLPSSPSEVEAAAIMAEIQRLGSRSAVILVNPLESRRLNRVYREAAMKVGIAVDVVSVADPHFDPARWWQMREGRKAVAYELFQWVGIP
jgi:hypothetical protein